MAESTVPNLRTTVVGSYPLPHWFRGFESDPYAIDDALTAVLQAQIRAGLDLVSDGEILRYDPRHPETNGMIEYFLSPLSGIETTLSFQDLQAFREKPSMQFRRKPAGVVKAELGAGTLKLSEDWRRARNLTDRPVKFTVTSPFMLAKTVIDKHYRNFEDLTLRLADLLYDQLAIIDTPFLQVDEANLPGDPSGSELAAKAVNRLLSAGVGETAVHLCFGNYGGQPIQEGHWTGLLTFFNHLECDYLILEAARRGISELSILQQVRDDIRFGIGVIDIKTTVVESADLIARRIEAVIDMLGADRLAWVHPDCGFWMLPRSVADAKMKTLVEGRDLFLGA